MTDERLTNDVHCTYLSPGGGRILKASATRGACKELVREIRALGGDGREDGVGEQPAHRRDGNRSGHWRATEHRIREQSPSSLRVAWLPTNRITPYSQG